MLYLFIFKYLYINKMRNSALYELYKVLIVIVTLISFYLLSKKLYYKEFNDINVWQFPMLVAILLEIYIY